MVRRHRHTVPALIAAFLLGLVTIVPAAANNTAQPLPFTQDWTNTSQINFADNWSTGGPAPNTPGVQGIIGFLGQDITTLTDIDPQTLLGVSASATDVDVIPNQTNTAITNGGVGGIPDSRTRSSHSRLRPPRMRRTSCSTSTRPALRTSPFRTTCATSTRPADNAIQQFALQYRVGSSGFFTNVPAGYVADATDGERGNEGHARERRSAGRRKQPATGPGPRDDHERCWQRRVGRHR